ncbi:tRNA (adenosine(37)-N6)-threonylcarbamoyltransferase complex dimerization subunit type 1 TsaB [Streptococcus pneumoniae]
MKVLSIDTSSKALALAILDDRELLAEMTLNIKKNHSITLMPAIEFLMGSVDLTPKDLEKIVVAEGPGSYTGLRIAVATAKTLAHTLKIDLVGVSSLQALVPEGKKGLVIPIMDARRNNVYAGFYENDLLVEPEAHLSFEEVLGRAKKADVVSFVGEVAGFVEQIKESLPEASWQETLPNAYRIGKMGLDLASSRVHDFVPNYLKRVEAEENWLKDHQEDGQSYIKRL